MSSYSSWRDAQEVGFFGYPDDDDDYAPEGDGEGTPAWGAQGGEYVGYGRFYALTDEQLEDLPY